MLRQVARALWRVEAVGGAQPNGRDEASWREAFSTGFTTRRATVWKPFAQSRNDYAEGTAHGGSCVARCRPTSSAPPLPTPEPGTVLPRRGAGPAEPYPKLHAARGERASIMSVCLPRKPAPRVACPRTLKRRQPKPPRSRCRLPRGRLARHHRLRRQRNHREPRLGSAQGARWPDNPQPAPLRLIDVNRWKRFSNHDHVRQAAAGESGYRGRLGSGGASVKPNSAADPWCRFGFGGEHSANLVLCREGDVSNYVSGTPCGPPRKGSPRRLRRSRGRPVVKATDGLDRSEGYRSRRALAELDGWPRIGGSARRRCRMRSPQRRLPSQPAERAWRHRAEGPAHPPSRLRSYARPVSGATPGALRRSTAWPALCRGCPPAKSARSSARPPGCARQPGDPECGGPGSPPVRRP